MIGASIIQNLAYFMIISALLCFLSLRAGFKAAYGRYDQSIEEEAKIPAKVAWLLQEIPSFLIPLYYLVVGENNEGRFVLLLFIIHYTQRTFYYPTVINSSKGSPISIFISALLFCIYNGFLQGEWHGFHFEKENFFSTPSTYIGTLTFFVGMFINIHSDSILRNLRKPGDVGYKIPRGGLFEYVSGANYFGEIIEWIGFALVAKSLPSVAFAIFVVSNIGPRALQHHEFYLKKFADYPKKRKAIIPFIV